MNPFIMTPRLYSGNGHIPAAMADGYFNICAVMQITSLNVGCGRYAIVRFVPRIGRNLRVYHHFACRWCGVCISADITAGWQTLRLLRRAQARSDYGSSASFASSSSLPRTDLSSSGAVIEHCRRAMIHSLPAGYFRRPACDAFGWFTSREQRRAKSRRNCQIFNSRQIFSIQHQLVDQGDDTIAQSCKRCLISSPADVGSVPRSRLAVFSAPRFCRGTLVELPKAGTKCQRSGLKYPKIQPFAGVSTPCVITHDRHVSSSSHGHIPRYAGETHVVIRSSAGIMPGGATIFAPRTLSL